LDPQTAPALPPPGYQFVDADVFALQAQEGLAVGGSLAIEIEYGDVQLLGNPVRDPHALQILRIANGQTFFLPTELMGSDRASAMYVVDASSGGGDQFGEFALVQAIAQPPAGVLIGAGLILLAMCFGTGLGRRTACGAARRE